MLVVFFRMKHLFINKVILLFLNIDTYFVSLLKLFKSKSEYQFLDPVLKKNYGP